MTNLKYSIAFYEKEFDEEKIEQLRQTARSMTRLEECVRFGFSYQEAFDRNYVDCLIQEYRNKFTIINH